LEEDVWAKGEGRGDSRLHSEEIHDFYYPPAVVLVIKTRRMGWVGHVACMTDRSGVCRFMVGKSGERKLLGRPRCRWENNLKLDQFTALNQQNAQFYSLAI
jgi:hypothetical protein